MGVQMRGLSGAGAIMAFLAASSSVQADVVISTGATSNVICASGICTPTSANAVLNVGDLQTLLASGNVKLAAAGEPVDVDITAPLSWVSTNTLTLDSYHSINVQQAVAITGGGGLAVITNDGGSGGVFSFAPASNVAIWSLSSSLTINGIAYTLVDDIATLASDVAANPGGSYALAGNYNAAPDGTYPAAPVNTTFAGNFQGLGNTISNLTIENKERNARVGLFSATTSNATISNIVLLNIAISESTNGALVGSVVGESGGALFGDHAGGAISGLQGSAIGGLVGDNEGTILNSSSSTSTMSLSGTSIGGLVGLNNGGTINGCFASGGTSAKKDHVTAGGLVGEVIDGNISNSYATGSVLDKGDSGIGGLVGFFQNTAISTSYSTGAVTGNSSGDVGGFIGVLSTGAVSDDYWNKTTSKDKDGVGRSKKTHGITGLTSSQLQASLPTGFDPTIWAQSPSINNGFPYLIANPPR
jgi:hypothetical protein